MYNIKSLRAHENIYKQKSSVSLSKQFRPKLTECMGKKNIK
jgi:hypothetical protein